jgi:tRNA dimethylallyltransferase
MGGCPDRPGLTPGPAPGLTKEPGRAEDLGLPERRPAPRRPAVIVAGPTASGKSALALAIARAFDGVVINADSMQVYRELRILTARPGEAELALAPHRLYGVLPAAERCSAGRWRRMAEAAAEESGKLPVFAGGTGLYLRALSEGLSEIPPVSGEIAEAGAAKLSALGAPGLHAELAALDPVMAGRLAPGDSQRIFRAWTVRQATGRSLAEWQAIPPSGGWPCLTIALLPPREALYAACDARFARMVEQGAVEEVRSLLALRLDPTLPAMRAVGVRELARAVAGKESLQVAVAAAQQATRRYAKRQMTWIRHQMRGARILEAQYSERILPEIFNIIRHFLLTTPA